MRAWAYGWRFVLLANALAYVLDERATGADRVAAHELRVWAIDVKRAMHVERYGKEPWEDAAYTDLWMGRRGFAKLDYTEAKVALYSNRADIALLCRWHRLCAEHADARDVRDYEEADALLPELRAVEAELAALARADSLCNKSTDPGTEGRSTTAEGGSHG